MAPPTPTTVPWRDLFCLTAGTVVGGLANGAIGPMISDISRAFGGLSNGEAGLTFTAVYLGCIAGDAFSVRLSSLQKAPSDYPGFIGGLFRSARLARLCQSQQLMAVAASIVFLSVVLLYICPTSILSAHEPAYFFFLLFCFLLGFGTDTVSIFCNAIISLWNDKVLSVALNFLHFGFGLGAVSGPWVYRAVLSLPANSSPDHPQWQLCFAVMAVWGLASVVMIWALDLRGTAIPTPAQPTVGHSQEDLAGAESLRAAQPGSRAEVRDADDSDSAPLLPLQPATGSKRSRAATAPSQTQPGASVDQGSESQPQPSTAETALDQGQPSGRSSSSPDGWELVPPRDATAIFCASPMHSEPASPVVLSPSPAHSSTASHSSPTSLSTADTWATASESPLRQQQLLQGHSSPIPAADTAEVDCNLKVVQPTVHHPVSNVGLDEDAALPLLATEPAEQAEQSLADRRSSVMFAPSTARSHLSNLLHSLAFWLLAICILFYNGAELVCGGWIFTLAEELGFSSMSNVASSLFWAGLLSGRLLSSLMSAWLATSTSGILNVLRVAAVLSTVCPAALLLSHTVPLLLIFSFLSGLSLATIYPSLIAVASMLFTDPHTQSPTMAISAMVLSGSVGPLVFPALVGAISDGTGSIRTAMIVAPVSMAIVVLLMAVFGLVSSQREKQAAAAVAHGSV